MYVCLPCVEKNNLATSWPTCIAMCEICREPVQFTVWTSSLSRFGESVLVQLAKLQALIHS